jgi:hypothetical protein
MIQHLELRAATKIISIITKLKTLLTTNLPQKDPFTAIKAVEVRYWFTAIYIIDY